MPASGDFLAGAADYFAAFFRRFASPNRGRRPAIDGRDRWAVAPAGGWTARPIPCDSPRFARLLPSPGADGASANSRSRRPRPELSSGTPVAAEAVADGPAISSVRLAHPGLAAGVDVAPAAAAELVLGPRAEASRRSGTGAAATDRGVEPDVLPTAGVRLADRTRTFTPPAPGDLSTPSKSRGHASPKTTKLYDRTADTVTVDEIERIVI